MTRREGSAALDRFATPLYTVADTAGYLGVPERTVATWNHTPTFTQGVADDLAQLEHDRHGWPQLLHLPGYTVANLVADPNRSFGQPIFARGAARLEDALALFRAGEPLQVVADEYGMPRDELEDAVRVATRTAA